MAKRDLIERLILLVMAVLGLIALRFWVLEPVRINEQMANDYVKENDLIVAVKNPEVNYGDFLLYEVEGKQYVGRVIAKGEDRVTYMADVLYRNDEIIPESYLKQSRGQDYFTDDFTISSLTGGAFESLPQETFLVLNDNRKDHKDSRTFGLIPKKQIIGRLSFRVTPLDRFGFIENGLAN